MNNIVAVTSYFPANNLQSWNNVNRGRGTKSLEVEKTDWGSRRTVRVSRLLQVTSKIKIDKCNRSKHPYLRIDDEEQGDGRREAKIGKWEGLLYEGEWRKYEEGKVDRRNTEDRMEKEKGIDTALKVPCSRLCIWKEISAFGRERKPITFSIHPRSRSKLW